MGGGGAGPSRAMSMSSLSTDLPLACGCGCDLFEGVGLMALRSASDVAAGALRGIDSGIGGGGGNACSECCELLRPSERPAAGLSGDLARVSGST